MIVGCGRPQMIGPNIGGSERGLEKEKEIQRGCLACACIQLLKVTSPCCFTLPLSSLPLFPQCLSVCTVYPGAAARLRNDLSLSRCSEFNHVKTATIYSLFLEKKIVVFFERLVVMTGAFR